MFGLGDFEWWSIAIGCVVTGLLMIGLAVFIGATMVDWQAIRELRAARRDRSAGASAAS
jgi:hypothetical protein